MGRSLGALTSLAGLAALIFAVWWLRRPGDPAEAEAGRPPFVLPVTLATVERGTVQPRVALTGTVRSPARAQLAFEVPGVLTELAVREVDEVAAGAVLARLDAADEELAVAQAEADLALTRRELEKLEAGTREEEKRRLAAELAEREADEALARTELERGQRLVQDKVISQADLDRLAAELAAASARKDAKAAQLAEAEAGTRAEDLAIAAARVDQAETRLAVARQSLQKTRLVSPVDGIVLRRLTAVGAHLAAGAPVVEVVDLSSLEVVIEIPGRYAVDLGPRPPVTLTLDDVPSFRVVTELDARVPAADERSRNFVGLVRLDAGDPRSATLQPGMFVRAEIGLQPREGALIVPADALRRTPDGTLVARALEGPPGEHGPTLEAQMLTVRVLAVEGRRAAVEVPGGAEPPLDAGDRVVVIGVDRAFPGAPLLVTESPSPAAPGGLEGGP